MVKDLGGLVGKRARYHLGGGFSVDVRILDAKRVFGRTDVQIEPVTGDGQKWVSFEALNSIAFNED